MTISNLLDECELRFGVEFKDPSNPWTSSSPGSRNLNLPDALHQLKALRQRWGQHYRFRLKPNAIKNGPERSETAT